MRYFARRTTRTTILFLILSGFLIDASAREPLENSEVKEVVVGYFNALNQSDIDTILGLYHEGSVFLPKNAPAVRGIGEIAKAYRALFERARLNTNHVYNHVSVHGDIAIVESQGSGTLTLLENKKALPSNNKELFVLRKINDMWKIDYYMFNDREGTGK